MHVVSVSLGSSTRDHRAETVLLGNRVVLERIGTDGDERRARALFRQLDGKVDAFGVGGADLGIVADERYYPLRSGQRLVSGLRTPVVDGTVVRRVVERRLVQQLAALLPAPVEIPRVLITTGVARYDMVCSFHEAGYDAIYGDFGFGLGIPVPISSLGALKRVARLLLPLVTRLPVEWLYPTGESQERIAPRFAQWYQWASVIAGDFIYIRRHLPDRLDGKIVVTNTTTAADVELLRERGVRYLCTTTPRVANRSFGTNVLEAALTAIAGKGRPLTPVELRGMLTAESSRPTVLALNE